MGNKTKYVPAYYTNVVNSMLNRNAKPGQGGHLEGNSEEVGKSFGWLDPSPFLFSETANTLGLERSEAFVRGAMVGMGQYRGMEIRRHLQDRGLALNAENLDTYWDFAAENTISKQFTVRDPDFVAFTVNGCTFYDHIKLICPQRLAVIMCEHSHQEIARGFNPAISVWYPSLLTRGEAKCEFRFTMSYDAAQKASMEAEARYEALHKNKSKEKKSLANEERGISSQYRAYAHMVIAYYHFMANELLRNVGEEVTEEILVRTVRKWGNWRGKVMREDHEKRNWPLNIETFITYYDDFAAGSGWTAENVILSTNEHTKDITFSPYSEMFETLGTGRFAFPFLEELLPAQAKAYNSAFIVKIPLLIERGDPVTRINCSLIE